MRRRAFTPDALGRLEARVALSAAGHLHAPFALDAETYGEGIYLVKNAFQLYGVSGGFQRLRAQLASCSVGVPYRRATGHGQKTNALLRQMLANIHAHAPRPIRTAMHEAVKATH